MQIRVVRQRVALRGVLRSRPTLPLGGGAGRLAHTQLGKTIYKHPVGVVDVKIAVTVLLLQLRRVQIR